MNNLSISGMVCGITDGNDNLIEADELLAQLQLRCGGSVPGLIAVPELLELVRNARQKELRLAREFTAYDGNENISGFVRISPERGDGQAGCEVAIEHWRQEEPAGDAEADLARRLDAVDKMVADLSARLDPDLQVLNAQAKTPDLEECAAAMQENSGVHWSNFIQLSEADYRQPLHWRLIDGARATVKGSRRDWRIRLLPSGLSSEAPDGFELLLVSDQPWLVIAGDAEDASAPELVGAELTRILRQPVSRIISNADTIRERLAGPLRDEYSNYAGDIASAGQHLLALLNDLADLEAVEAEDFAVLVEPVDLAEIAARAVGILRGKAAQKNITVEMPTSTEAIGAKGEGRRVMQVLINLLGNAINYSPADSTIRLKTQLVGNLASVSVIDEGPGLDQDQQQRIFTKFERLGRDGDGGSGLGLYISRRLAEAMGGELKVKSAPGEGACFTLSLPAA